VSVYKRRRSVDAMHDARRLTPPFPQKTLSCTATKVTPKQEKFCQIFAATGNATKAYRTAYNVRPDTDVAIHYVEASRLLKLPHVAARVAELRAIIRDANLMTLDAILHDLSEITEQAKERGQMAAAVSAITAKARLAGILPDRVQVRSIEPAPVAEPDIQKIEIVFINSPESSDD
jgi:phage terminase small subunit